MDRFKDLKSKAVPASWAEIFYVKYTIRSYTKSKDRGKD